MLQPPGQPRGCWSKGKNKGAFVGYSCNITLSNLEVSVNEAAVDMWRATWRIYPVEQLLGHVYQRRYPIEQQRVES